MVRMPRSCSRWNSKQETDKQVNSLLTKSAASKGEKGSVSHLVNSIIGHGNQNSEYQRSDPGDAVVGAETGPCESEKADCFERGHYFVWIQVSNVNVSLPS